MSRDQDHRPWKRRSDDWRGGDDLRGVDTQQERDLRHKLLRNQGEESSFHQAPRGDGNFAKGGFGGQGFDRGGRGFRGMDGLGRGGRSDYRKDYYGDRDVHRDWGKSQYTRSFQEKRTQGLQGQDKKMEEKKLVETGKQDPSEIKCFRCLKMGHHQSECNNEPVCYKCKAEGHLAAECGIGDTRKLQMFGFGIPKLGFYAMEFPAAQQKINQAIGLVTVKEGMASEEKLNEDLSSNI